MNTPATNPSASAVQSFCFDSHKVRTIADKNGDPWFVAQDICNVLGLANARKSLERIPEKHKGVTPIYTLGGKQNMNVVDEPGLYRLILRSDKPQAEPFMEWVTSEVLPTIRRTGRYESPISPVAPAPSPSHAQPVYPAQPHQPTRLSFNYRESAVEVVLDANNAPLFNADDIFAALGYARSHGAYHWLRCHADTMRTFPAAGEGKRTERKYFPLELLYQFLRHSGKIEKFRFIRWLEERVLPDLPKVEFTPPPCSLDNLLPFQDRTAGACFLLTFDEQQQPSLSRLAARENANITFYDVPGAPNFKTTTYYPIDLMLEKVRLNAMASGPDRKNITVTGVV